MGAWEMLLQQAGKRTAPVEPPKKAIAAANDPNPTPSLPAGLAGAISALTAVEQALLDNPAILAALAADTPGCWATYPDTARRDWVRERLGLSPTRYWVIAMNGRRDLVKFVEPQTRERLLEQAAQNRPGIKIEVTPALRLKALCDNANRPVDKSENPPMEPDMQQATLLPDTASHFATGPVVATVSAAELLQGAGVAVRYIADPAQAAAALAELLTLPDTGPWGLDIETMPLPAFRKDSKAGLDPWRSSIRLLQVYPGGGTCFVFDIAALGLSALRELLQARTFVAHNAVFELKHLLHAGAAPARLGCTLLQDNALGNGRRSLAALVKDRLNWAMDKALQVSDWTAANLTGAQLEYAALDAVAAYQLARVQAPQLQQRDLSRCYQLMRDAQLAIARLELAGCPFDTAAHTALIAQWQSTAEQARGELDSLLNGANPDSPLQLSKWLSANLPAETLATWPKTATGQLQTDADALAGLTLPALEPLARYKTAIKGLSTYGKGYAAHISPVTGRIHASFTIGGTATGRLSCSNPNIQNPPRDPAFRALFAPTPGRCLVVADYGQIELRVAALVSGDPAMLAVYEAGEDLHRKTAAAVLGIELERVTKAQRQMAKACIAAGSLVLTDTGLVPIEQVTRKHLLWDGVTWVHHDGVVYQGYRKVITYDGLTATPDHVVFLETGETGIFTEAANSGGLSLARGEFEGNPVRFLGSSRGTGAENRKRRRLFVNCFCRITKKIKLVNLESLLRNLSTGAQGSQNVKYLRAYQDPAESSRVQILGDRYDAIHQRCNNPNYEWFPNYGGRGIRLLFNNREQFVNWIRENLPHTTYRAVQIDRIDNNGHYEPGNLRLVSIQQNLRNTRRNRYYEYQGMRVVANDLWHLLKTDYPDFALSPRRTAVLAAAGIPVNEILGRQPRLAMRTSTILSMPAPAIVSLYRAA